MYNSGIIYLYTGIIYLIAMQKNFLTRTNKCTYLLSILPYYSYYFFLISCI